jgi:hypothetical protein
MAVPRRGAGLPETAMDRLLRAQYFFTDVAAFVGIAMAWSSRYGGQPHPFVTVQTMPLMPGARRRPNRRFLDFDSFLNRLRKQPIPTNCASPARKGR